MLEAMGSTRKLRDRYVRITLKGRPTKRMRGNEYRPMSNRVSDWVLHPRTKSSNRKKTIVFELMVMQPPANGQTALRWRRVNGSGAPTPALRGRSVGCFLHRQSGRLSSVKTGTTPYPNSAHLQPTGGLPRLARYLRAFCRQQAKSGSLA